MNMSQKRVNMRQRREDMTRKRETDVWDPCYDDSIALVSMDRQGGRGVDVGRGGGKKIVGGW